MGRADGGPLRRIEGLRALRTLLLSNCAREMEHEEEEEDEVEDEEESRRMKNEGHILYLILFNLS